MNADLQVETPSQALSKTKQRAAARAAKRAANVGPRLEITDTIMASIETDYVASRPALESTSSLPYRPETSAWSQAKVVIAEAKLAKLRKVSDPTSGSTPNPAYLHARKVAKQVPAESKLARSQRVSTPKPKSPQIRHRDEKVDPSPASGGIPNPSIQYLPGCFPGPVQLSQPQHLLVVIDLNGTLLYRPNKSNPTTFNMRPHAVTFLRYCVDTFTVVIWSSARPNNVNAMCNTILTQDIRPKVAAIWGRDMFGLSEADYDKRTQCYKRLSSVWQDLEISRRHPGWHEGRRWDQTNTVLIDDSREKARTEPHNLIEVPEYCGDLKERDDILPQVHDYLNHLSMHSNVSACLRSFPWRPTVYGP